MDEFIEWLENNLVNETRIPTLGGRSSFKVRWDMDERLLIITDRSVNNASVNILNEVLQRYLNAHPDHRGQTSYYGNQWEDCPDYYLCPYVAAVISLYIP